MTAVAFAILPFALLVLRQNVVLILIAMAMWVHLVWGAGDLAFFAQDLWSALDKEAILALPLFILVGEVMSRGSVARRLITVMEELTRPLPGGLGVATILSCAVFSAISGSSIVTLMAVGSITYPALIARGYPRAWAVGALAAGGTLGMMIPPSLPMILYGIAVETSITDLFLAGVGPGLLITAVLAIHAMVVNRALPRERWNGAALIRALKEGGLSLFLPVLLLGGIYSGHFSPTEAAAVGLFYCVAIESLVHRELTLADYGEVIAASGKMVGMLFPLVAVAVSINLLAVEHQLPQRLLDLTLSWVESPLTFILAVNALLLVAGCFLDPSSAILVLGPLLAPMAEAYGYHPTQFGIVMILNLEVGFLTPPVGLNLMVAMTVFNEKFGFVCRSVVPFIIMLLGCLVAVTFMPGIAMWLVR